VDYTERLRCLTINASRLDDEGGEPCPGSNALDQKSLTLARLAALIAVGGAGASYGAQTDAAIGAGATPTEIVDVLIGVIPLVGLPRAVAAAPKLALALGYDIEEALQYQPGD
jgi:4-carboxymuconolactone decarboxylase